MPTSNLYCGTSFTFSPELARPLFDNAHCSADFNPLLDEMFELAERIICDWDKLSASGKSNKEVTFQSSKLYLFLVYVAFYTSSVHWISQLCIICVCCFLIKALY